MKWKKDVGQIVFWREFLILKIDVFFEIKKTFGESFCGGKPLFKICKNFLPFFEIKKTFGESFLKLKNFSPVF